MLQDFLSRVTKEGVSKPNLFTVEMLSVPDAVQSYAAELLKDVRFYAEAAEFPGTQLMTTEFRYYDMQQKLVYGKTHDDFNLTLRLDRKLKLKTLIDKWMNSAYNPETGNVRFKKDYVGTIRITQYDEFGNAPYSVELEDCFPFQVGSVQLGWDQGNSYSRLSTTFSFRTWWVVVSESVFEPKTKSPSANSGENLYEDTQGSSQVLGNSGDGDIPSQYDSLVKKYSSNDVTKIVSNRGGGIVDKYVSQYSNNYNFKF